MSEELGSSLLQLARKSIEAALGQGGTATATTQLAELSQPGACFVTLTQNGELRGCIGSLEAWRPLHDDVCHNAVAAALNDSRFAPLRTDELDITRLEVSLLSAPQPLTFNDEADALHQLRPGIDGVIFAAHGRRSTFLPQVWEQLPTPAVFMAQLKRKAGLPADYWSDDVQLWRYTVQKWQEPQPTAT
jgi:AmmeMemoRadiSam system protein A